MLRSANRVLEGSAETTRPRHAWANRSTTTRRARPAPRHLLDEGVPRNGRARTIALGHLPRPTSPRRFSLVDGHSTGSMIPPFKFAKQGVRRADLGFLVGEAAAFSCALHADQCFLDQYGTALV